MPRQATGSIRERASASGLTWNVRVPAYGERHSLTYRECDGWTREKVEVQLAYIVEQARRGEWRPPVAEAAPAAPVDPTFREFASDWFEALSGELAPNTVDTYRYQLE